MRAGLDPFTLLVVSIAGWMNRRQQDVIEYLIEENHVLREQIGKRRMGFSDNQRRRLAAKAKKLGRKVLGQIATIVTPKTLLAWHRKLIAKKHDGSAYRRAGRPKAYEKRTRFSIPGRFRNDGKRVRECPLPGVRSRTGLESVAEWYS